MWGNFINKSAQSSIFNMYKVDGIFAVAFESRGIPSKASESPKISP